MPGFKLAVTLVAAAFAIGNYFFGNKDDDDDRSPPCDSYNSSSSYNSGTRNQTHRSYRPPPQSYSPAPSRSYSFYTPETNAQSKTTTRSPAPPDYGRDVYRQGIASTRTLRPTQPSTRTQASRPYSSLFDHFRESSEYDYSRTSSHHICAENESRLPTAPMVVSSDFCSDKPAIVEDLEYAKKLREKARRKGLEMSEARSRAKSAQKKGSRGAAHIHKQEAMVRESEMKDLDKRAAKIIFRENNKVSGQLDICQRFSNGCSDPLLVLES